MNPAALTHIQSRDNPQYRLWRQLAQSGAARRKQGLTLLDGIHLCQMWMKSPRDTQCCVISESALLHPEVRAIIQHCQKQHIACYQLSDSLYRPLAQVEQGINILFVISRPQHRVPSSLAETAVLLDRVQDPGNLGSILRSAAAAGIRSVCCSTGTAAVWSPKVLRAGMGAHFALDIYENVDLGVLLQHASVPAIATSLEAGQSLYAVNLARPLLWLFGHEGQGVSEQLMSCAQINIRIPQTEHVESLNVAASAAICFYEQWRQLHPAE